MQQSDTPLVYGRVSRLLHWSMAAVFAWQFLGMIMKVSMDRTPLVGFFVGSHSSVGVLLFLLILIRLWWALGQKSHRPPYGDNFLGTAARLGHIFMYVLMLVVPTLAIMRMIGGDRPIKLFGVLLREGRTEKVEWLMAPANLMHGFLAWTLLALIVGHIIMALVHRFSFRDDVMQRMI